jgi:pimeloyl-ACP methyl ester carboxylesterase
MHHADTPPRRRRSTLAASRTSLSWLLVLAAAAGAQTAAAAEPLGIAMENYAYPHSVHFLPLTAAGEDVRLAYMDVPPQNGVTDAPAVVLFHGKNFFGAYWKDTIDALNAAGYRVVVPDQIGFGKSSKPAVPYSFHTMAAHTKALLEHVGIERAAVLGHSMGGMLAVRFALMYADATTHLVLENPLGLEDYRIAPYVSTEARYQQQLRTSEDAIRRYHESYYVEWRPEYEEYVQVHYRWTLSGEYPRFALSSALTAQTIYEQPVVHELGLLEPPTLLVIGQEDRTAPGKNLVPESVARTMGHYPTLGERAAAAIPDARLARFDRVGHIPHVEAPERFHAVVTEFLAEGAESQ